MTQQRLARIAGLFYALNVVLGILALVLGNQGRADAANLVLLLAALDYALVALLLGRLFEPAGRALSWAVAVVGLAGCALSAGRPLHLFTSPVNALAVFGLYCIGLGVLVVRSALLPRVLGFLLMLGGVSWLTFASPALAQQLAPFNMAPGAIAEILFTLWLLIFAVRDRAQGASSSPQPA
jgi:hypothetical protein